MKRIFLYLALLAGASSAARAQNIYAGGISDGFAARNLGAAYIYAGGSGGGFAMAAYSNPTPLPLTLLSFNAQPAGNTVLLRWKTTNEVNTDRFDVERAAGAHPFQYLTSVAATGNGSIKDYQAVDPAPTTGVNSYRLKEMDKTGAYQYSNTVSVTFGPSAAGLTVYPNPAVQTLYINIISPMNTQGVIAIYSEDGRLVARRAAAFLQGTSSFSCDISTLSAGLYFCRVEGSALPVVSFVKK